jgi:hypothetical protein
VRRCVWWSRSSASGGVEEAGAAEIGGGGRRRIWGRKGEAGLEVDDGADGWAPSVGEREREEGGWTGEMSGPEGRERQATGVVGATWAAGERRRKRV